MGENPGVFTQGSCFLPWIAESYGMELGPGLAGGCRAESGDVKDLNKTECKGLNGLSCQFNLGLAFNGTGDGVDGGIGYSIDQCFLIPGDDHFLSHVCFTSYIDTVTGEEVGQLTSCPNNCVGVDASDIIAGGAAVLFAASTVGTASLTPALAGLLGLGGLTMAGFGLSRATCSGPLYCVTDQGSCCLLAFDVGRGSLVCPATC